MRRVCCLLLWTLVGLAGLGRARLGWGPVNEQMPVQAWGLVGFNAMRCSFVLQVGECSVQWKCLSGSHLSRFICLVSALPQLCHIAGNRPACMAVKQSDKPQIEQGLYVSTS